MGPGGESTVVGVEVKLRAEDIGVEGVEDGGNGRHCRGGNKGALRTWSEQGVFH